MSERDTRCRGCRLPGGHHTVACPVRGAEGPDFPDLGAVSPPEAECWCEYVDIGVGMQKVAHNDACPQCNEPCADCGRTGQCPCPAFEPDPEDRADSSNGPCTVLPNGQGPSCDWGPDCEDCQQRAAPTDDDRMHLPSGLCLYLLGDVCPRHH